MGSPDQGYILWGPTPASIARKPRAVSAVSVFGQVQDTPKDFAAVPNGASIRIERIAP
jgi:hypothetical protein